MYTGIYSDTEGWNRVETFPTREEVVSWFEENGIDIDNPEADDWWNPSPTIISGPNHEMEQFDGFEY